MAAARVMVDVAARRRVSAAPVLARLGISQSRLRDMTARLDWPRYLELLDGMGLAFGGADALGEASSDFLDSAPELTQIAGRFATPGALMRFVYEVIHHLLFPMVDAELVTLDERRFRVTLRLVSADRHHALFAVVATSTARGVPRLLGCGPGLVTWTLTRDGAVFELEFPERPQRAPLDAAALKTLSDLGLAYLETFGREVPAVMTEACDRFLRLVDDLGRPDSSERLEELAHEWGLTQRQAETLRLLVGGLANKDIAAQLGISHRTVEIHLSALLQKANVESRAQLLSRFWKTPTGER